jgi:alpha-mannosidase
VGVDAHDGTLTIVDRRDGTAYAGCNAFEDGGDAGDTYTYAPPARDLVVDAPAEPPRVTVEDDPLGATMRVALALRVPAALTASRGRRSPSIVTLPVVSTVQLTHGVPRIDITTTVENAAHDHRLRVRFAAPFETDHVHAEDAFAVTRRALALPAPTEGWAEQPALTAPQQGVLAVHGSVPARGGDAITQDGTPMEKALLVASRGLPEYEVRAGSGQTEVLLTLLRSVGWLSRDDLSTRVGHAGPGLPAPEAQCPGMHTATYALLPWAGGWRAGVPVARAAAAGLTTVAVPADGAPEQAAQRAARAGEGELPPTGCFLRVTPQSVAVSALKGAEDGRGLILRLCNLADGAVEARVELGLVLAALRRVTRTSLAEDEEGTPLAVQDGADGGTAFSVALGPWAIVTLRLEGETRAST